MVNCLCKSLWEIVTNFNFFYLFLLRANVFLYSLIIEKGAKTWTINIWNLLTTEERALPFSGVFLVLSTHIFAFITLMKIFRYAGHAAAHQSFTCAVNIGQKTKKEIKAFPKLKWHFYYLGKWCIENESLKVLTVYMKIQFLFFIYHCCNLFFFLLLLIVIYSEEPPRKVNKLLYRTTLQKRINDRIITLSDTKKMIFQKFYLLNHKLSTVALTNKLDWSKRLFVWLPANFC